jgi:hypothetical protein
MKVVRSITGVRLFLAAVAAVLVWCLIVCPKPWTDGVAAAEAAGIKLDHEQFVASYFWPMAVVNLALCVGLFFAVRWLVRPIERMHGECAAAVLTKAQRGLLWVCLLVATGSTLYYTVPRMTKSLWVDEERTARRLILGNLTRVNEKGRSDDLGKFTMVKPISWGGTIWRYRTPNNHPFYSLSARLSHEAATKISPPYPLHFREWPIRLPALIAGVGSLFAVSWVLLTFGFARAAMIAPLLLAVHAYFLRFSSDARGYSMTFLLAPLCAIFLWKAIKTGLWRWWAGFALAQFLVAWSHGSSLYFLVVLNLWGFAVPWLWKGGLPKAQKLAINGRHFLMSCFSGMAFLQMFLPNLAQASKRFAESEDGAIGDLGLGKIQDMLSLYFSGINWQGLWGGTHPYSYKMADRFSGVPILMWVFLVVLAVLFIAGLWRIWRLGGAAGWFFTVLLVPGPLMYVVSYLKNFYMFDQYIIISVPWIIMALAVGLSEVLRRTSKIPAAGLAFVGLFLAVYWWVCEPQRTVYRERPVEQNREAVLMARGSLDPKADSFDDVITAGFVRYPRTYDLDVHQIKKIADVDRLVKMSDDSGKPLWIYLGVIDFSRLIGAPIVEHIEKNSTHIERLYGLDGMSIIDMYRHDPLRSLSNE